MKRQKYGAKPTTCIHGHKHASKREAARCVELHLLQNTGAIADLEIEPTYRFIINGVPVKMGNGQVARYRPDFRYTVNDNEVVEDVKGMTVRDFPLRAALFRTLFPTIQLKVVK
jgi:hypothetical protein